MKDVASAPIWFAHVDTTQLSVKGIKSEEDSIVHDKVIHHMAKLREWANQSLKIEVENIHGITIFGTSASRDDACFLLKGKFHSVQMREMVEIFPAESRSFQKQYHIHRGLKWLGFEWYFTRLNDGEIVAANRLSALRKLLLGRGKKSEGLDVQWGFDAVTKREIAGSSAVVAFNMEAIHRELELESILSSKIKTVSLVVNQIHGGTITTNLVIQAKDANAMRMIAPELQILINLVRAYEEVEVRHTKVTKQHPGWSRAKIDISESRMSIQIQGSSNEMIKSLQSIEKLLPKRRK